MNYLKEIFKKYYSSRIILVMFLMGGFLLYLMASILSESVFMHTLNIISIIMVLIAFTGAIFVKKNFLGKIILNSVLFIFLIIIIGILPSMVLEVVDIDENFQIFFIGISVAGMLYSRFILLQVVIPFVIVHFIKKYT